MKTQDMNLTPDRQGYLGDLADKSVPQLKELLERQEKILLRSKFLERMPDKGEKTRRFAAYLKQLIEQKSSDSSSSPAFTDRMIGLPKLCQKSHLAENVSDHGIEDIIIDKDRLGDSVAKDDSSVRIPSNIDNTTVPANVSHADTLDSSTNITSSLEKMSLGSSSQRSQADTSHYINSYERVIKNKEATSLNQKPKFLPFRTLKDTSHIPASPYPHGTRPTKVEREELSAVNLPCYKYPNTKLISVEESVQLIEQQRTLNEELTTQRAARKLADQLIPKMDMYSPESADMRYRETAETDQDSDDDDASQEDEY